MTAADARLRASSRVGSSSTWALWWREASVLRCWRNIPAELLFRNSRREFHSTTVVHPIVLLARFRAISSSARSRSSGRALLRTKSTSAAAGRGPADVRPLRTRNAANSSGRSMANWNTVPVGSLNNDAGHLPLTMRVARYQTGGRAVAPHVSTSSKDYVIHGMSSAKLPCWAGGSAVLR